jgi:Mrp family chromosome partitioning ATPase
MSRNFEVLSRAAKQAELFRVRESERDFLKTELPCVRPQVHIDEAVQQEEIKLIERVFLMPREHAPHIVAFFGVETAGGTVGICARAGQNLAEKTGLPVCLVDGDLTAPGLHNYFGVHNRLGLAAALSQPGAMRDYTEGLDRPNLFLISAGHAIREPAPPWKSSSWLSRLSELRREFHYILIVGPPIARESDAILMALGTDGVILVLESQLTHRETARAVKQRLDDANVTILGAVLNNRSFPIPESIYRKL